MRRSQCPPRLRRESAGRSLTGVEGSNPAGDMDVCLLWVLCVLSGRGVCDGLIFRAAVSYPLWCVLSVIGKPREWSPRPLGAVSLTKKKVVCSGLTPSPVTAISVSSVTVEGCSAWRSVLSCYTVSFETSGNTRSSTLSETPSSTLR
jgi:hypothetical protein